MINPKTTATPAGERELLIEREFAAPRELVFKAWTERDRLMQWWGPPTWPNDYCTVDLRVGGAWHYRMRGPAGGEGWGKGVYREIMPASRLVYSDFASKDAVWLRDISLIVPVAILVTVFAVWLTHRDSVAAQRAFAISASSIAFMLVFSPLMGGIPLEAPMYQAMLWPPALIALAIAATHAMPDTGWTRRQAAVGVRAVVVVIATAGCQHRHQQGQRQEAELGKLEGYRAEIFRGQEARRREAEGDDHDDEEDDEADDLGPGIKSALDLLGVVRFDEHAQMKGLGKLPQEPELQIPESRNDEQDRVGLQRSRLVDLVGVADEGLAQHRQGHVAAGPVHHEVVPVEVLGLGDATDGGGTVAGVLLGKNPGVEELIEGPVAGAAVLDLGDDLHLRTAEHGTEVPW